jgi:hypothetical protein
MRVENWLTRAAGLMHSDRITVEDLIATAAQARRCHVVVSVQDFLALSEVEREALSLADAALQLAADEETWADRARAEFAASRKAARNA